MSDDNGGSPEDELDLTVTCRDCGGTGRLDGGQLCMICVGTGRIDPVLWRKPDETASFRDLAFSEWRTIVLGEEYFGLDISPKEDQFGPNIGDVITLLRRGEPVPKYGQRFLADLLERMTTPQGKRKLGSPKKPPGRLEQDRFRDAIALLKAITSIRQTLAASGGATTWAAAYRIYAQQRNITPKSAEEKVLDARKVVQSKIEECERNFAQVWHPLANKLQGEFLATLRALIPGK